MKFNVKSVIRIFVLVLLAALIGVSFYSITATKLNGDALPMPLGFGMTVVLSGSMEPELSVDDLLFVVPVNEYEVGDVVVYQNKRSAIVHRIVAINDDEVITKGDANDVEDDPIKMTSIKGLVVFSIPFVGYLVNLVKTPVGIIILLGLAIWLLEASFKKDKKQDQSELDVLREEIEKLKNEQNQ